LAPSLLCRLGVPEGGSAATTIRSGSGGRSWSAFVGALIIGGVIGAFNLREPAALTVSTIYVAIGVAVLLLAARTRHLK
jgi:hypothetical protein